jgi:hypothetical protein
MINNNINTEIVTIQARHQNLYMTKKIDDSHFFEILQDNTQLFVKNRTGPWRSGASNKAKYLDLIHEGFNSLSWLINQASLEQILATKKPRWNITNEPLPEQAPLRTLIPDIKESLINAHIELESKQDSIKYADITINLSNTTTNIIIKLIINLSAHDAKNIPDTPTLAHEEGINIPVNIATRFKQLMDEAR